MFAVEIASIASRKGLDIIRLIKNLREEEPPACRARS